MAQKSAAPRWRGKFLECLAETSNVSRSARRANTGPANVYSLRRNDPQFEREWFAALCEGYDRLEMELLQRLRAGDLVGGNSAKSARAKRKFDNACCFRLLAQHRQSVGRHKAQMDDADEEAVLAALDAKLDAMREREAVLKARSARDVAADTDHDAAE